MPITAQTLKSYKRGKVLIETGCYVGDGVQAALEAGFDRVITIELNTAYAQQVRSRFSGKPVTVVEGDTVEMLPWVLNNIVEPCTLWLDAHPYTSTPVLEELAIIKNHSVKTHTILIDDRRLFGTDWTVLEKDVHEGVKKVNPSYIISYADGYVPNDIIVAQAQVKDMYQYASNVTSQFGEDGIIAHIVGRIGSGGKAAVEFGAADGKWLSNTYALEQRGWTRYLFDGDNRSNPQVHKCVLTAESIVDEFDKVGVPDVIDVLSIDTDGNDLWLWAAINRRVRLLVAEYNAALPVAEAISIGYNPQHSWDRTSYYGASLHAFYLLGKAKGMRLVHVGGINAFFVDEEEAKAVGLPEVPPVHETRLDHGGVDPSRGWVRVEF